MRPSPDNNHCAFLRIYLYFYLKDVLDKLDDATTELMSGEGDSVMLMLGDGFVVCEEEYATEFCERKQEVRSTDRPHISAGTTNDQ